MKPKTLSSSLINEILLVLIEFDVPILKKLVNYWSHSHNAEPSRLTVSRFIGLCTFHWPQTVNGSGICIFRIHWNNAYFSLAWSHFKTNANRAEINNFDETQYWNAGEQAQYTTTICQKLCSSIKFRAMGSGKIIFLVSHGESRWHYSSNKTIISFYCLKEN